MNIKSRTLFHFTRSKTILKSILIDGFWPRYCVEDTRWIGQENAPNIAFPITCFCDIPLSRISEHVNFYGEFGLGMTRDWAIKNGLNPVHYLVRDNNLNAEYKMLNIHANRIPKPEQDEAKATMRYLFAHVKPASGIMILEGQPIEKDFYQENEWRHVSKHKSIAPYLLSSTFADLEKLEAKNAKTREHCMLKLVPSDVRYIFVPTDSDIPDIMNFIQTEMDSFPSADLKLLMSRVTSLESIREDV